MSRRGPDTEEDLPDAPGEDHGDVDDEEVEAEAEAAESTDPQPEDAAGPSPAS